MIHYCYILFRYILLQHILYISTVLKQYIQLTYSKFNNNNEIKYCKIIKR